MISINIIKSYRDVVAICDKELLGKIFEEPFEGGIKQLDIKESFYKGEESDIENAKKIMQRMSDEDATFNIVGQRSVNVAIESGIITPEEVMEVSGIPFALVLV